MEISLTSSAASSAATSQLSTFTDNRLELKALKPKQNFDSRLILEHRSVDRYTTYLLRKVWIFDSGSIACTTVSSMRGVSGLGLITTPSSGSSFFAGFLLSNFLQAIVTLHIRTETVLQFLLGAPLQHSLGFRIITHRFLKIRLGEDEEL